MIFQICFLLGFGKHEKLSYLKLLWRRNCQTRNGNTLGIKSAKMTGWSNTVRFLSFLIQGFGPSEVKIQMLSPFISPPLPFSLSPLPFSLSLSLSSTFVAFPVFLDLGQYIAVMSKSSISTLHYLLLPHSLLLYFHCHFSRLACLAL